MTVASYHTQACFNAWMNCEDLLVNLASLKLGLSKKLTKVVDECAMICMGTFHALKTSSQNTRRFALLCVGICEECAELCESQNADYFRECAKVCRKCAETMSVLAFTDPQ
ncbi:MAG TPA: hypothetical protein VFR58_11815 [Flavisolibacter sp.]|nr:hypothetical protein [Flavisolibacter sp.]